VDAKTARDYALSAAEKLGVVGGVMEKLSTLSANDRSMQGIVRQALAKLLPENG
jgi:hypothetical protein